MSGVLADTSVWIAYFKEHNRFTTTNNNPLAKGETMKETMKKMTLGVKRLAVALSFPRREAMVNESDF